MEYISQYTTNIQHISGTDNQVADALSRIEEIAHHSAIDYDEVARSQANDPTIDDLHKNNTLQLENRTTTKLQQVLCETSSGSPRPYLPSEFRRIAFHAVHDLCHPGVRATRKLLTRRYFWPAMNVDVGMWTKACVECQRAKTNRHTVTQFGKFEPARRFEHVHMDIVGPLPISNGQRYLVTMVDRTTS